MVRNKPILNAEDSSATFTEAKLPSGTSEAEICQVRILAPKDVATRIIEWLTPNGLSVSGYEPEKGYADRFRTYLVMPIKDFRKKQHLNKLLETQA